MHLMQCEWHQRILVIQNANRHYSYCRPKIQRGNKGATNEY